MTTLTDDDKEELLLASRYGDLEEIQQFVAKFGSEPLAHIRDENNNCLLHMVCGNGHLDALEYLLHLVPSSLLATQNNAKSTPLHWAALNSHLPVVQKLVEYLDGPGIDLIDIKNAAGRSPLAEAELTGWDEGAAWLVKMMNLSADNLENGKEDMIEDGIDEGVSTQDIQVEIEDAEGQVAKMTIGGKPPG